MARLNLTSAMLLDNKSFLTALEPATEPCSDSAWVEGPGPITKLLPEMVPTSFDNLDAYLQKFYKIRRKYYGSVCLATPTKGTKVTKQILRNLIGRWIG